MTEDVDQLARTEKRDVRPVVFTDPTTASRRLQSLDVFRGLTMAAMVIVNNPGDWGHVYWPLLHAPWHGWTPTDLIFPYFLFIVGVAITFSDKSRGPWRGVLARGALLVALGLFLNGFPRFNVATWRFAGVLQRIGLCYVAAVAIYRLSAAQGARTQYRLLTVWVIGLLVGYWALMTGWVSTEGIVGDLSPDGNLAARLDRALMEGHLWKPTWDPEGVLSTVPAVATTVLGIMAGLWLRSAYTPNRRAGLLALVGALILAIGLVWHVVFPINKNLWTSSYVLFTGGAAALTLAGLYWLIDIRGFSRWSWSFVVLGRNAIVLFVMSSVIAKLMGLVRVTTEPGRAVGLKTWLYRDYYAPVAAPEMASLAYAVTNLLLLFGLLYLLYRRRIFLRL